MMDQDQLKKLCVLRAMDIIFSSSREELVDTIAEALQEYYNNGNANYETFKTVILNLLKEEENV